jgi:hypothetical protein
MRQKNGLLSQSDATPSLFAEGTPSNTQAAPAPSKRSTAKRGAKTEESTSGQTSTAPDPAIQFVKIGPRTIKTFLVFKLVVDTERGTERHQLLRDESGTSFFLARSKYVGAEEVAVEMSPQDAIGWCMGHVLKGFHETQFIMNVCGGSVWTSATGHSPGLSRHLGKAVATQLRNAAARDKRSPYEQLRAYVLRGLAEEKTVIRNRRWAKRHNIVNTPRGVQLELATSLVEVVRKLETAPSEKTLATARDAADQLKRSLSAEGAEKVAKVA